VKVKIFFSIYCILLSINIFAQSNTVTISGHVFAKSYDNEKLLGLEAVTVRLILGKDTLIASTSRDGQFFFKRAPVGKALVRFSHLGYNTETRAVEILPKKDTYLHVEMQERSYKISEAVIKSSIPVVLICGDTLIYNAAAIMTMKGDAAIEIVKQLPGVIVDENGNVTIMGRPVSRTYLNSKIIFGDDPMTALRELLAKEVTRIKVYGEATDEDRRRKNKDGKKQLVLNIETRDNIINSSTGHILASYGTDLSANDEKKLQQRYGIGATVNFFSEMFLLSSNAFYNNLNRKSNRLSDIITIPQNNSSYNESGYFEIASEKHWKDRLDGSNLKVGYVYENNLSRSKSIIWNSYFPTAGFAHKEYYDTTINRNISRFHMINIDAVFMTFLDGRISTKTQFGIQDDNNKYNRDATNITGNIQDKVSVSRKANYDNISLQQNISWTPFANQNKIISSNISLSADLGDGEGSGWRIDTMSVTGKKIIRSSSDGFRKQLSGDVNLTINFNKNKPGRSFILLKSGISYLKEKNRQISYNEYDPMADFSPLDTASTYNYTYDYNTKKIEVELHTSISRGIGINIGLKGLSSRLNKSEVFPDEYDYGKTYNSVSPLFQVSYFKGFFPVVSLNYSSLPTLPSLEQIRRQINDENPMILSVGNPTLKQSFSHLLNIVYSALPNSNGTSFSIKADINLTDNLIASKSIFYNENTKLPQYDNYTAPARSTLYTYENVNGALNVSSSASYSKFLKTIKSTVKLSLNHEYSRLPSYINENLNMMKANKVGLNASLRIPFGKNHRLDLSSSAAYTSTTRPSMINNKFVSESFKVSLESNFLKSMFFKGVYNYMGYQFIRGNVDNINNHFLSMIFGYNINNCAISISGFDLLNRNTSFKSVMMSDHLQNSWTPSFGTYWSFNISYKFNSTKSTGDILH